MMGEEVKLMASICWGRGIISPVGVVLIDAGLTASYGVSCVNLCRREFADKLQMTR